MKKQKCLNLVSEQTLMAGQNSGGSTAAFEIELPPQSPADADRNTEPHDTGNKMKSGKFLIFHTISNTLLMSGCAIYISLTR